MWYLQIGNAAPVTFAAINAAKLARQLKSQAVGTFAFEVTGPADADPLAAEGTLCAVSYVPDAGGEATQFFSGKLYQIPRTGQARSESVGYEIRDAWEDFARNIFQQQWAQYEGIIDVPDGDGAVCSYFTLPYTSHLILGMGLVLNAGSAAFSQAGGGLLAEGGNVIQYNLSLQFELQTLAQAIEDVVTWLTENGLADCQLGTIDPNINGPVPFMEVRDQTCAEVLKKLLRLTPDAVAWFDYTQAPPAFNVTRRAECASVPVPLVGNVEHVDIHARPDLVPGSVVIRYEQVNTANGQPSVEIIPDVAPPGATGAEYGAIVASIKLAGSKSTFQSQTVKVVPVPQWDDQDWDEQVALFFSKCMPGLSQFNYEELSITINSTKPVVPNTDTDQADYPNHLVDGNIPAWVMTAYNIVTGTLPFNATINYASMGNSADDAAAATYFKSGYDASTGMGSLTKDFSLTVTNATSTTYTQLTGFVAGESVPAVVVDGQTIYLAAYLWNIVSQLQYEGRYRVLADEVAAATALGVVLNITGGRAEWNGMNALVQQVQEDLDDGATTYVFGPAEHITIQDLLEQVRAMRISLDSGAIQQRLTGNSADSPSADTSSGTQPHAGADPGGDGDTYPWIGSQTDEDADPDDDDPPYDAVLGYGASSFAMALTPQPAPLECFEIDVGNTGDLFSDDYYDSTSVNNALSIISGDSDPTNDILWIGATNDGGDGGSIVLTPYDETGEYSGPSLYLSPNLDGSVGDDDEYIELSLSEMIIGMYDGGGGQFEADLSGDGPALSMVNDGSTVSFSADLTAEGNVTLTDDENDTITLDLADDGPIITVTAEDGSYSSLDASSVSGYDGDFGGSFDADAADLDGDSASFLACNVVPAGDDVYVLATDSFTVLGGPSGGGSASCPALLGTTDDESWSMIQIAAVPCPGDGGSSTCPLVLTSVSGALSWQAGVLLPCDGSGFPYLSDGAVTWYDKTTCPDS